MSESAVPISTIEKVRAREVLDSRGNPTIETEVYLRGGAFGRATIPSGASTGKWEAVELRDQDPKRYQGKGVLKAVEHVNKDIASIVVGKYWDSVTLDRSLIQQEGTKDKSRWGANAMLSVSLAFAKACAVQEKKSLPLFFQSLLPMVKKVMEFKAEGPIIMTPLAQTWRSGWLYGKFRLPCPLVNIVNGGMHADNALDIQEFMIVPVGAPSFAEALRYSVEVFHTLKALLKKQGLNTNVGDEGGFAPQWSNTTAAIEGILEAIVKAGLVPGKDMSLALDVASSSFYKDGKYVLSGEKKTFTTSEWIETMEGWVNQYPLVSIEDGLDEEDWAGWTQLTERLGNRIQLVGDDLFVTNTERLQRGIEESAGNAILIKPNQIGTLSETLSAIIMAQSTDYGVVISHRSGETEDTIIADLAVGTGAGQIKTGSVCRGERIAKYNQLLRMEASCLSK
jgi:enolase